VEFRERWRSRPIHDGQVEFLGDSGGFGSSPQRVRLLPGGCVAFAKRALNSAGEPEGAHEYIASELANLIGVSVPPVGFWHDNTGNAFVLSIRAFRETVHWNEVRVTAVDQEALRPIFSASAVFHTWIADVDHSAHPENLVVDPGFPEGHPRVSFIDHAQSLTAVWRKGDPPATPPEEYYIGIDGYLRESVLDAIQRANGVSERVRESMISRVPVSLLPAAKAATILECLRCRASELRAAFAVTLGGS
jgi:hypothetical protein